jgi:hypothetical protein
MNPIKKSFGTILLNQILATGRYIGFGSRPPKKERRERNEDGSRKKRQRYVPGTIGLSAVSQAILKDQGRIHSRRERKSFAKSFGVPFKAYYNGPTGEPQYNRNIGRSKYNGKGELI